MELDLISDPEDYQSFKAYISNREKYAFELSMPAEILSDRTGSKYRTAFNAISALLRKSDTLNSDIKIMMPHERTDSILIGGSTKNTEAITDLIDDALTAINKGAFNALDFLDEAADRLKMQKPFSGAEKKPALQSGQPPSRTVNFGVNLNNLNENQLAALNLFTVRVLDKLKVVSERVENQAKLLRLISDDPDSLSVSFATCSFVINKIKQKRLITDDELRHAFETSCINHMGPEEGPKFAAIAFAPA